MPLERTVLSARAAAGFARVCVEQHFSNPYAERLDVTYSLPLPADAAVVGFSFRVGARRVEGVVERRAAARARYEKALMDGRSAARNVPPGAELVAEVTVEHPLA